MILVTGTEHASVPLWMEILVTAGFPGLDRGFRAGVNWTTNPNPGTGVYLFPEQVEHHAVRTTIPGLVRTDRAYIGRVIAAVRRPSEFVAQCEQVRAIEALAPGGAPPRLPPWLEWWSETYGLVRDAAMRRYPAHVESHARLVSDPERVIREVIGWLGRGDAEAACARVKPVVNPVAAAAPSAGIDPAHMDAFEALYAAIESRSALTPALVQKLNETHGALVPQLVEAERRLRRDARAEPSGNGPT